MLKKVCLLFLVSVVASCTKKVNLNEKVLNVVVDAKVKGYDPAQAGDTYSSKEIARVYEGLLQYHYLKRPYQLIPNLAQSMPQVSEDGLSYTFKIKKGVKFHDNKCFPGGKGRELKAADFVFGIMRVADTHNRSTGWWLLDGKIKGLNEWREKYANQDKANYDDKIEGLNVIDDHTLEFKLTTKFPQFLYSLAMVYTYAVPREAVEFYGKDFVNNPVGTGPFMTGTYKQGTKIIYHKNPNYHEQYYPNEGEPEDKEKGLLKSAGKRLPLVEKIVINILPEKQPAWLALEKGKVDFYGIPKDQYASVVTPSKELTDRYAKKGINLEISPDLDITYISFNLDDPLFKNNKKLRQAFSLAYDVDESLKLFYSGKGIKAQTVIPPGIAGYDPEYKNPYATYDLEKAKKLLSEAGYPNGKGLPKLTYDTTATTVSRQMGEYLKKSLAKIGVEVEVVTNTWPKLAAKVKTRQSQMYGMAWLGDYPDAENFLQLLYGPNSAPGPNGANYNDPKFNALFKKASMMQDSPERSKLYEQAAQYAAEEVVYILGIHRTSFKVKHSWLKNYKFSTFEHGNAKYYDIDLELKKKMLEKL